MKYTTVHFPQDLLASQEAKRGGEDVSVNWVLVRRWRVLARRFMLVAIALLFIYTTAIILLLLLPMIRIDSLGTARYALMCVEEVAWLCALGVGFYAYCKKRAFLRGVTVALFILLVVKALGLLSLRLQSIWCARPEFGEKYMFTVPLNVLCINGSCTFIVAKEEQPSVCSIMEDFFKEMADRDSNLRALAGAFFSQQLLQVFLAVAIIVHATEDHLRLGY